MRNYFQKCSVNRLLGVLFLGSLTICLWLGHIPSTALQVELGNVAVAQSSNPSQLVQRGVELYQAGDISGAIAQWETALSAYQKNHNRPEEAIVLENLARAYQQIGQIDQAIHYWNQIIAAYREMGNRQQVGRMLAEQAQAYSSSGQHRRAIAILCNPSGSDNTCTKDSALQIARETKDRTLEAAALGSLGNAYRFRGDYTQAIEYLEASLKIAQEIDNLVYRASALNGLGNTYTSLALVNYRRADLAESRGDSDEADKFSQQAVSNDTKALQYFLESIETASDVPGKMRGHLNSIPAYYRTNAAASATEALKQALSLLEQLPDSRDKVYAAIDLAHLLQPVTLVEETSANRQCLKPELQSLAQQLLQQAVLIAQRLKDRRSESFALGELGHAYECRQDFSRALDLTQQARWTADQDLQAQDSLYLWEWQVGRIFKAQGKNAEALKAYEQAVATLETIRSDILTANRDLQLDFRDAINPIYRELAQLRLEQAALPSIEPDTRTKSLTAALNTIDSLKLAELQNYFGNDCVLAAFKQQRVELAGNNTATAVFSSIILKDRTAILVSLPNGETKSAWIDVDSKTLTQKINEFRRGLERFSDFVYDPTEAQTLYNWIIRPFVSDLEKAQIKTLVFIQDGILRSIPMAALHDGETFLVQKYAIATTPSLTLTDPKSLNREKLRALAVGLTKEAIVNGQTFPALTNVSSEISAVVTKISGSKQLLDEDFTRDRIQQELSQTVYPIIHIATHGEFSSQPEDTFLVTGNNGKLTITDLDTAIRRLKRETDSVELLVLTACQTAVGDDRAALGLAGVAVQAGVRSALASLWFIQDAPTVTLVAKFYASLNNSEVSKAEALRAAQLELIEAGGQYAHPAYWAPFILIGNWL
ncbi:MAG TPA: CHAT domain-containing protein [Stenomitos sp.]